MTANLINDMNIFPQRVPSSRNPPNTNTYAIQNSILTAEIALF